MLAVAAFAEVDLERRARVPDGRGAGQLLAAVQVAERDVVARSPGRRSAVDVVVEDGLGVALAAAEPAAAHHAVGDDEVDGVGAEVGGQRPSMQAAHRSAYRPACSAASPAISCAARTT